MKLLAIDPGSYHAGFYDGHQAQTCHFKGTLPQRLGLFHYELDFRLNTLAPKVPDVIAFEESFMRGIAATKALYGQAGIIMALAERHGCAVLPIKITDWKKWAKLQVGTVKSDDKQPTIELAQTLTGLRDLNEHEADAIIIWHYVMAKAEKET